MRMRNVECPVCGTFLAVPPGVSNCFVRCGTCHHRFKLPRRISVTEETIAEWLWEDPEREAQAQEHAVRRKAQQAKREADAANRTAVLPAIGGPFRVAKVGKSGALVEFPAERLKDWRFRCAMPRRCLRCGARTHLSAHVIYFAQTLRDSYSLEAEHSAGALRTDGKDLTDLDDQQMLDALPRVPNVPPPVDLPMPYWLCDMCTGAGLIGGQVQVKSDTGSAICRVHFRNIHRALEFALAAGGEDAPGTAELRRRAESSSENPWQHLPETVQHRIQVWWSPRQGERFLTYVPDRDHVRTEDGMAGIVVTSQRLIHHTPLRHKEIPINERVELKLATSSGRGKLKIQTRNWDVKRMTIDREGISRLRRGLTLAKFPAVWA